MVAGSTCPSCGIRVEPGAIPDSVTDTEREVLRLIGLGWTCAEIAAEMHLSVRTVEWHRGHLRQKLRAHSRRELTAIARRAGL